MNDEKKKYTCAINACANRGSYAARVLLWQYHEKLML